MNAAQLIKALSTLPQDLPVYHVWDGEALTQIRHVWVSADNTKIVTADNGEVVYSEETAPANMVGKNLWIAPDTEQRV